jgi:hypothetical protein
MVVNVPRDGIFTTFVDRLCRAISTNIKECIQSFITVIDLIIRRIKSK